MLRGEFDVLSEPICARVTVLPWYAAARNIVLYSATGGEVRTDALRSAALSAGMHVFYPSTADSGLDFIEDMGGEYRIGRWGIAEPASGRRLTDGDGETLFIVPGSVFDLEGYRLGRGLGMYDKSLVCYPYAKRIGLAYEFQFVPVLPRDRWDVPMDAIVSDSRTVVIQRVVNVKETT